MYNSLSLSLPQVFVKEHLIYQTPISRTEAVVGYNAYFFVPHFGINILSSRADGRVERLESTSSASNSIFSRKTIQEHTTIHLPSSLATSSKTRINPLANPRFLNPGETSNRPTSLLCRPVSISGMKRLATPATSFESGSDVNCTAITRVPASTCAFHSSHDARILSWESGGRKVASVWSVVMQAAWRRAMEGRRWWDVEGL